MRNRDRVYLFGFASSVLGHLALAIVVMFQGLGLGSDFGKPIVYSVTIERGDKVGGIAQAPKKDKSQIAPPKAVQEPIKSKPAPKKEVEEKKIESKTEPEPVEEPEVSIAEPTPAPTPAATPAPTPESTPKPTPQSTPKPKATPKPAPKSTPKPAPKKLSAAEIDKRLQQAVQRYSGESTDAGGKGFGSVGGGERGGFGGGQVRPPEYFEYQGILMQFIKTGWRWHDRNSSLSARVCFEISPEGVLSEIRLCGASGNNTYDSSVLRAVQKANPVPPPPEGVYQYFREVRMSFSPVDY